VHIGVVESKQKRPKSHRESRPEGQFERPKGEVFSPDTLDISNAIDRQWSPSAAAR